MTLFVDASAAVAILALEDDHQSLILRLQKEKTRIWSAMAKWETFRGLTRAYKADEQAAEQRIASFEQENGIRIVPIAEREAQLAILAHMTFGRNNHPAELNMGDCFAYACAKANNACILYKGNDFVKTDLG